MKFAGIALAAALTAALILVAVFTHSALQSDGHQIALLQQTASRQAAELHQQVGELQGSVNGAHRDLITCGDLQQVEQLIDGLVAPQGDIGPVEFASPTGGVVSSLPLPSHCINN
jgi:hypothetical protein